VVEEEERVEPYRQVTAREAEVTRILAAEGVRPTLVVEMQKLAALAYLFFDI
jgi:hypothetical protein